MKAILLALSVTLALPIQTPTSEAFKHNERIEVQYDKFKDITAVILYGMKPGLGALGDLPKPFQRNQIDISLITNYPGKSKPMKFQSTVLMTLRFEPDWPEYALPDLILLIDGRREVLPTKRGLVPSSSDSRYEARIDLSYQTLNAIRNATRVEGQFGAIEFHFDKENFEAVRDFDSRLRP